MLKLNTGITMIEVMVTLAITTIGLLGISALQLQSNRATLDSGNRSQAVWMLEDLANRINANSSAIDDYATGGEYSCPNNPPKVCSDSLIGGAVVNAQVCTAEEVAAFDLWDISCSKGSTLNGVTVRQSFNDFISNPRLSVTVNNAERSANLSITWDVRTSGNSNGNTNYFNSDNIQNRTSTITRQVQL